MKKVIFPAFLLLALTIGFNPAFAAVDTAPGQNKLTCFDGTTDGGYNGTCTLKGNGARGPALLNTNDGDEDPYNNYAGVYVESSTMYGEILSDVTQLAFNYSGDDATAGSPRISLPVDTDGDGDTDMYLYISAYYCNDGEGTVDVINDSTCTIYSSTGESWANWDELVSEYPTWTVANDNYVFIIADDPGTWTITGVKFGSVK